MIDEASQVLAAELVAAYEPYVREKAARFGVDLSAAINSGRTWLDEQLIGELSNPYARQQRGPLEIFQAAMSFPTEVLLSEGLEQPPRDAMAVRALPGDHFDLAPASSRDIGEDVWAAHLAWGVAKAMALRA